MIKGRDSDGHEGFLPRPRSERGWRAEIDMSPAEVCSRAFVLAGGEDLLTCVHTWLRFHYVVHARARRRTTENADGKTAVLKFLRANVPEGTEEEETEDTHYTRGFMCHAACCRLSLLNNRLQST